MKVMAYNNLLSVLMLSLYYNFKAVVFFCLFFFYYYLLKLFIFVPIGVDALASSLNAWIG